MQTRRRRPGPLKSPLPPSPDEPHSGTGKARLKVFGSGAIGPDHANPDAGYKLIMEAIGTENRDFCDGIVRQIADATAAIDAPNEKAMNFMLSVIKGIKPKDQFEVMLGAQMAAVHTCMMTSTRRLTNSENSFQEESSVAVVTKLARTFTTQMETLKRYRSGIEPTVTVQHVSVSEGGQAIVGNITQGRPENEAEKVETGPLAITDAKESPMEVLKESKAPVLVRTRNSNNERS